MGWLFRLLRRRRHVADETEPEEEPTADEIREDSWIRAGWVQLWIPTLSNPIGRRHRYWARRGPHGLLELFPEIGGPPDSRGEPHFYVNDKRVYRHEGHPEGPSSIPLYAIRRRGVYPSEGYPAGSSERKQFDIKVLHAKARGVTVRPHRQATLDT